MAGGGGGPALPAPPNGEFAAAISQNGPSVNFIHRVLQMKKGGKTQLALKLAYNNTNGSFATPKSFDFGGGGPPRGGSGPPNQQLRIDLVKPSAPLGTLKRRHLKAKLFRTDVGDPAIQDYERLSWNLTKRGVKGRFRLRIAEVDNQSNFFVGLDAVKLKRK